MHVPPSASRAAALLLLAGVAVALPSAAQASTGPSGACTDPAGVTVVVDSTNLGGEIEVGCADTAATGTEALLAAGFTEARDPSGFICAVDGLPDPCPTTFEGTYWSYWFAAPGGEWTTYAEGSDTAVPAPGSVEGWRYGDGSAGPGIAPPGAPEAEPVTEETAEETAESAQEAAAPEATEEIDPVSAPAQEQGGGVWLPILAGLGTVALVATVLVVRRRRTADVDGQA